MKRCERLQLLAARHVQAIGEERDKNVCFDAALVLVKDGPDCQIAFESLERCLDLDEDVPLPPDMALGNRFYRDLRPRT